MTPPTWLRVLDFLLSGPGFLLLVFLVAFVVVLFKRGDR